MMVIVCVSCQDNCKMAHIPGFTYPVQEFYMEEIIEKTGWVPVDIEVYMIYTGCMYFHWIELIIILL